MARQSIDEFLRANAQQQGSTDRFVLETSEILEVNVDGHVWAKVGTMVDYNGEVRFERQSSFDGGMKKFLKKQVTGEGAVLMKMEGRGRVYLADRKKKIAVFDLAGQSMSVNGNDLLAMESGIDWDIEMTGGAGITSGGLFNMKLSGQGMVAITTKGKPLTLRPPFNATNCLSG
ncbi:AIM24 family protein [Persicimonas caeni]|uniref:AIM24 family protein n=1 Tax=Persicimonas caeni TaxID=2292766 RepID=A0A4Y6PUZ5_PERCE|nr:AIM24 family protein [Persicimonas caeni]QDG52156.1 AIM24 family protein [Persicimonas caeni]QED33378.1 AIM24 family protein [Persicimonas caeni]